jgi:ArsR family transcriptional regulator, lead/cadmium/zinc/bismuth-responsive transcriptional repressor
VTREPDACGVARTITAEAGKPPLDERPLITAEQAQELVRLFKVLAGDSRLRLIHALARGGEVSVTELAEVVGMRAQAVSNQLQRLLDRRILGARRDGNRVFYRIADPCVPSLLDLGLCLAEETRGGAAAGGASPALGDGGGPQGGLGA